MEESTRIRYQLTYAHIGDDGRHQWNTDTGQWEPTLVELRKLAAARQTAANKLNEECRNADVWVPGNMAGARPSGDDSPTAIATAAGLAGARGAGARGSGPRRGPS